MAIPPCVSYHESCVVTGGACAAAVPVFVCRFRSRVPPTAPPCRPGGGAGAQAWLPPMCVREEAVPADRSEGQDGQTQTILSKPTAGQLSRYVTRSDL